MVQNQKANKQLSARVPANHAACIKGLQERFELDCKKELYLAKFETRSKSKIENWATFAEDLKTLINKAFPTDMPGWCEGEADTDTLLETTVRFPAVILFPEAIHLLLQVSKK